MKHAYCNTVLALTFLILLPQFLTAQPNPEWIFYTTANSNLPDDQVRAIAFDSSGNRWIGTAWGLAKFDSLSLWTVYNPANSDLPDYFIWSIAVDGNDNKWIGTWGDRPNDGVPGGLTQFDDSLWTVYTPANSPLPHRWVLTTTVDGSGNKWIASYKKGLTKFDESNWITYTTANSDLQSNFVSAIAIEGNGTKWIGTGDRGIARFDGSTWTAYTAANSDLPDNNITSLALDPDGDLWIATFGGGLAEFDGTVWTVWDTTNSDLPDNYVRRLAIEGNGTKWLGFWGEGLAAYNDTAWTRYTTSNSPLPGNQIYALAIDEHGNKWISASGGGFLWGGLTVYNEGGVIGLSETAIVKSDPVFTAGQHHREFMGGFRGRGFSPGGAAALHRSRSIPRKPATPKHHGSAVSIPLSGNIIQVPAGQPTIQAGIAAAVDGDTVLVADGLYYENIDFIGKRITVASHFLVDGDTAHISNTIIDGSQPANPDSGSVVFLVSGEDTNSVLYGFTITGGSGVRPFIENYRAGGGVYLDDAGARIAFNKIENNSIFYDVAGGGGINADYWGGTHNLIVENNIIRSNHIQGSISVGGGLVLLPFNGEYIIRNNQIIDNSATGTLVSSGGGVMWEPWGSNPRVVLHNNVIANNQCSGGTLFNNGGGVSIWFASGELINNTITGNRALGSGNRGGGIHSSNTHLVAINSIVWGNTASSGPQIWRGGTGSTNIHYSDVQGSWPGTGNMDADPLLDSLFHLPPASPVIGAGIDSLQIADTWYYAPLTDFEGNPRPNPAGSLPDIGAWESPLPSPVGIEDLETDQLPQTYSLKQNYPNPFNPSTSIEFSIAQTGFVTLKIYNILGEEVATLVSEKLVAGKYKYDWDSGDLASGVYFYRIEAGNFTKSRKMLLIR
jgi:hypothetical protein